VEENGLVEIKLVGHREEIEQLVDLFRVSFGQEMPAGLWEWKYIANPFASYISEVVVAADNGKIVGARPFLPVELWIQNERVIAAEHCDTMVRPEYRNMGLFNRMGLAAGDYLKERHISLSFGFPGPMSRSGFLKQGYRKVVPTEILFYPLDIGKIIALRFPRLKGLRAVGSLLGNIGKWKIPASQPDTGGYQLEIQEQYNADLEHLDGFRNPGAIEFVRSEQGLRWRFDQHPEHRYKYVLAKKGGKLSGYAVISVQKQSNDLIYGMVVDYLINNGDVGCFHVIMDRAMMELAKTDCHLITVWAFNAPPYRRDLISRLGFISTAGFPFNRFIDHGYFDVLALDDRFTNLDVYHQDIWRITYAFPDFT
jgi:GNAT superfamily N-acetyltransferase